MITRLYSEVTWCVATDCKLVTIYRPIHKTENVHTTTTTTANTTTITILHDRPTKCFASERWNYSLRFCKMLSTDSMSKTTTRCCGISVNISRFRASLCPTSLLAADAAASSQHPLLLLNRIQQFDKSNFVCSPDALFLAPIRQCYGNREPHAIQPFLIIAAGNFCLLVLACRNRQQFSVYVEWKKLSKLLHTGTGNYMNIWIKFRWL